MLKTTVIMKTDIGDYTKTVKLLSPGELSQLLEEHFKLITKTIIPFGGSIAKGEGDAFWIIFESVTRACLCAMQIQQMVSDSFTTSVANNSLSIRIAIHVGDVLLQDNDFFGDAINFTARIEAITPVDGIYISDTAQQILNKNEVVVGFVEEFSFKGFPEKHKIYKLLNVFSTRAISNQVIMFTDIRNFTRLISAESLSTTEQLILNHRYMHEDLCKKFGGQIRLREGDSYLLTFEEVDKSLKAVIELMHKWEAYLLENIEAEISMDVSLHYGNFQTFDSIIFGEDINVAGMLINTKNRESKSGRVLFTEEIYNIISNTKLKKVCTPLPEKNHEFRGRKVYALELR